MMQSAPATCLMVCTLYDAQRLAPNVRAQTGRAKGVQHATGRRTRPCLHRACSAFPCEANCGCS
jgi:hypothetical protein